MNRGLADDDARAVVDEEALADSGAGWLSMPRQLWACSLRMRGIMGTRRR